MIDTANKRRSVLNIATPFLYLGLLPALGIDTNDRRNLSEVYIGDGDVGIAAKNKTRFIRGIGVGMGF